MTGPDSRPSGLLADGTSRPLAGLDPARSRHNWVRTAVALDEGTVLTGGPDGCVAAYAGADAEHPRWAVESGSGYAVSLSVAEGSVAVGTRGADAAVAVRSLATGDEEWSHPATDEVGAAADDSLLAQPYVVDVDVAAGVAAGDDVVLAAVRRYERSGGDRSWSSAVLGFDSDGAVRWRHRVPASPVALDTHDGRVAVAYNRRPDGGDGLVVLDAATGDRTLSWDPDAPGERRVGDVAFAGGGLAVASHADERGYRLAPDGRERWRVDLGTPRAIDDETVYTYPTHACVADGTAVFVTSNTFAESTRDPDARHPGEHTVTAVDGGAVAWAHEVGGFARGVSVSGSLVAVPSAQHFRRRDADTHAVHLFDACRGHLETRPVAGIAAAVSVSDGTLAAVEEPVAYHDDDRTRGAHRLHTWRVGAAARES